MRKKPTKSEIAAKIKLKAILKVKIRIKDKPDLRCKINNKRIGIEVIEACDKNIMIAEDAMRHGDSAKVNKFLQKFNSSGIAKSNRCEAEYIDTSLLVSAASKFGEEDYNISVIRNCINKKDNKQYEGFDELWLCIINNGFCLNFLSYSKHDLLKLKSKQFTKIFIIEHDEYCIEIDLIHKEIIEHKTTR